MRKNSTDIKRFESAIEAARQERLKRVNMYQSREMVPVLLNSIRNCLPDEQNSQNPDQTQLHRAYREGDRDMVMAVPRRLREQVFLSSIKIIFTDDLNKEFEEVLLTWRAESTHRIDRRKVGSGADEDTLLEGDMAYAPRGFGRAKTTARRGKGSRLRSRKSLYSTELYGTTEAKGPVAGFVVVLEGYTPHHKGLEFLFPPDVGENRAQWGFFNRLRNLGLPDKKNDADNASGDALPFEIYVDSTLEQNLSFHYTDGGWIDGRNPDQPVGLGILEPLENKVTDPYDRSAKMRIQRPNRTARMDARTVEPLPVYVDPFTYEPISVTYVKNAEEVALDDKGHPMTENHDYWFRVKFKVKLRQQPEKKT